MKNIIILLSLISVFTVLPGCSKDAGPLSGEITFITGTLKINNIDAVVGGKVSKDDTLLTGEKSEAVIQISETAVITLRSFTEMKFDNLINKKGESPVVSLKLGKGGSFHKILRNGTEYSVKSPTAVASVRGTSFEFDDDEARTKIEVETGTVYVRRIPGKGIWNNGLTAGQNKGDEDIILTAGQSLEIANSGIPGDRSSFRGDGVSEKLSQNLTEVNKSENIKSSDSGNSGKEKSDKTDVAKKNKKTENSDKADVIKKNQSSEKSVKAAEIKKNQTSKNSDKAVAVKKNKTVEKPDKTENVQKSKTPEKIDKTAAAENNKTVSEKTGDTSISDAESTKQISAAEKNEKAPDPVEVKKLINKKDRKLEDIKNVYNRIDRVYLYSGEIITGAIIERGEVYSIMKTDGIVKVSRKDIQSNEIIR